MSVSVGGALAPDDLEANRGGSLTAKQRTWLGQVERSWWKNELAGVPIFGLIGVLILTSSGGSTSEIVRLALGLGALVVAAFFLYRSIPGTDSLSQDLRGGKVEAIEGPFGKHTLNTGGRSNLTSHYLDIADRHFEVSSATYEAAPEAGMVRLYFLPRSHKVVNFERLADQPLPAGALESPMDALKAVGAGFRSHDQATRLQAMATMESMKDAMQAQLHATPPPPDQRDARPLAEAILGTWKLGAMAMTFAADGSVTDALPNGRTAQGRWSVLADGRLHVESMGMNQDGQAWVAGDTLTLREGDETVALKRATNA